jgi:hypothetical protein
MGAAGAAVGGGVGAVMKKTPPRSLRRPRRRAATVWQRTRLTLLARPLKTKMRRLRATRRVRPSVALGGAAGEAADDA